MIRLVRSLLLVLGLATLPACAAIEQQQGVPLVPAPAVQGPAQAAASGQIATTRTVTVHFDNDSAAIRAAAMQILYGAVTDLRGTKVTAVRVTGYADGVGKRAHNRELSERRAAAVVDQLNKLGVRAEVMHSAGAGEAKGGQRRNPDDRKVEVIFEVVQDLASAPPATTASDAVSATVAPAVSAAPFTLAPSPAPLRSADKQAIKPLLVLDGTARFSPSAAEGQAKRMGGRAV